MNADTPEGFPKFKASTSVCESTGDPKRSCKCRPCIGRRNRRMGLRKQREARKALGIESQKFGDANEETWQSTLFAHEVKAGAQVNPVANWWRRVEQQVQANEPDHGNRRRPVRAVAMPAGWAKGDGLVVMRLTAWRQIVRPALEAMYGEA